MNPDQFHEPPEDVIRDQKAVPDRDEIRRIIAERSAARDLDAEAEQLAKELKERATAAAQHAVQNRVTVSLTPRGRVRRNGPCPCGSGRKFKKCCLDEVRDPESDKKLPSPKAMRAYISNQKEASCPKN